MGRAGLAEKGQEPPDAHTQAGERGRGTRAAKAQSERKGEKRCFISQRAGPISCCIFPESNKVLGTKQALGNNSNSNNKTNKYVRAQTREISEMQGKKLRHL